MAGAAGQRGGINGRLCGFGCRSLSSRHCLFLRDCLSRLKRQCLITAGLGPTATHTGVHCSSANLLRVTLLDIALCLSAGGCDEYLCNRRLLLIALETRGLRPRHQHTGACGGRLPCLHMAPPAVSSLSRGMRSVRAPYKGTQPIGRLLSSLVAT